MTEMNTMKMRLTAITSVLALGILAPMAVQAESPSYDYAELGYVKADIDDLNVDGDGFGIGGSFGFYENWFMFAEYANLGFDFDIDVNTFEAGFGYHYPMSDMVDLAVSASYLRAEADSGGFSEDDSGYGLKALVRGMVNDAFELNGGINYVDFGGNGGSDTSFEAGALYSFTDNVAFGGRVDLADEGNTYQIGFRFYFNK